MAKQRFSYFQIIIHFKIIRKSKRFTTWQNSIPIYNKIKIEANGKEEAYDETANE